MSYLIKKGATSQSIELYIIDATDGTPETGVLWNTAGMDLKYRRKDAVAVSITEAALTTPALTDTWETGGFLEIGNGSYRLDLPDAAIASAAGIDRVEVFGTVTGMVVLPVNIHLTTLDLDTVMRGTEDANTTTPPTVTEIQTELEENGASVLDTIRDAVAHGTYGLSALQTLIAACNTTTPPTTGEIKTAIEAVGSSLAQILTDTGTTIPNTITTAQNDLDIITGSDGVTLATAQAKYAPAKDGALMGLANDAITAAKYDESTAFPIKSVDTGITQIARTGADGDTLKDLSDEIAGVSSSGLSLTDSVSNGQTADTVGKALENLIEYLDSAISGVGGATGSGAESCTFTITIGGVPVDNVACWITTDIGGTNVVAGTSRTNASGQVTFMLDDGTYYWWKELGGKDFTNPESFTVS